MSTRLVVLTDEEIEELANRRLPWNSRLRQKLRAALEQPQGITGEMAERACVEAARQGLISQRPISLSHERMEAAKIEAVLDAVLHREDGEG